MLILTEKARSILKKPLGMLIPGSPRGVMQRISRIINVREPPKVVTVGDYVTYNCLSYGIHPSLSIVNGKTKRKPYRIDLDNVFDKILYVYNPPSMITWESCNAIREAFLMDINVLIKVHGEEDLLGIPAIYFAPLGSLVIYGQPGEGAVVIIVTEEEKNKILNIVRLMERRRLNE